MADAPTNIRSPLEWRNLLGAELAERQELIRFYREYYKGDHRMAFATAKFQEAFGDLFDAFADNWCQLIVDTVVDRMFINGFRFKGSRTNDEEAWSIWQANRMDARATVAHTEAVKTGWAYVCVGPGDDGTPRITVESPEQVIIARDPADTTVTLAALKRYASATNDVVEVVYEPDRITTFVTHHMGVVPDFLGGGQIILPPGVSLGGDETTEPNPTGIVPVFELENNPDMTEGGVSDLRTFVRLQDAANKLFSDMIVASEFQAFRQRVLTGIQVPKDPVTGEPMTDIEMAVSRLMVFANPDAKAFDLAQGDLQNYINAIEMTIQHGAAQTRTPPHYLLAKLVNLSGDALKAAESGLNWKAKRKHTDYSDPWEDVTRCSFRWRYLSTGDEADKRRSEDLEVHTDWAPPETMAVSVMADSIAKKREAGWPRRLLMEEAGLSEQQIQRAEDLLVDERHNDLPDLEVIERIQAMHDGLGLPFEVLYKKYLGMSDAEIQEALTKGPLGRGGQTPAGELPPGTQAQAAQRPRRDVALVRGGSSR